MQLKPFQVYMDASLNSVTEATEGSRRGSGEKFIIQGDWKAFLSNDSGHKFGAAAMSVSVFAIKIITLHIN